MTRAPSVLTRRARRLLGVVVRVARRLARPALVLMALRVGVEVVGTWPMAPVAAAVVLVWIVRAWAEVEHRLDTRRVAGPHARPVVVGPRGPWRVEAAEHMAFARALVAVSARYLAHCEDQADTHTPMEGRR